MALDAGFDVLHHAHGITNELLEKASKQRVKVVATPMGGTHLMPNSPEDILKLVKMTFRFRFLQMLIYPLIKVLHGCHFKIKH